MQTALRKEWEALFESSDEEEFDGFYNHFNVIGKSGKINFAPIFCRKVGVRLIGEADLYVNHYGTCFRNEVLNAWHERNLIFFLSLSHDLLAQFTQTMGATHLLPWCSPPLRDGLCHLQTGDVVELLQHKSTNVFVVVDIFNGIQSTGVFIPGNYAHLFGATSNFDAFFMCVTTLLVWTGFSHTGKITAKCPQFCPDRCWRSKCELGEGEQLYQTDWE